MLSPVCRNGSVSRFCTSRDATLTYADDEKALQRLCEIMRKLENVSRRVYFKNT